MIALKSTLFNKWEKLAMLTVNPHCSNSVMEYFFAASSNVLLAYAISLGCYSVFGIALFQ